MPDSDLMLDPHWKQSFQTNNLSDLLDLMPLDSHSDPAQNEDKMWSEWLNSPQEEFSGNQTQPPLRSFISQNTSHTGSNADYNRSGFPATSQENYDFSEHAPISYRPDFKPIMQDMHHNSVEEEEYLRMMLHSGELLDNKDLPIQESINQSESAHPEKLFTAIHSNDSLVENNWLSSRSLNESYNGRIPSVVSANTRPASLAYVTEQIRLNTNNGSRQIQEHPYEKFDSRSSPVLAIARPEKLSIQISTEQSSLGSESFQPNNNSHHVSQHPAWLPGYGHIQQRHSNMSSPSTSFMDLPSTTFRDRSDSVASYSGSHKSGQSVNLGDDMQRLRFHNTSSDAPPTFGLEIQTPTSIQNSIDKSMPIDSVTSSLFPPPTLSLQPPTSAVGTDGEIEWRNFMHSVSPSADSMLRRSSYASPSPDIENNFLQFAPRDSSDTFAPGRRSRSLDSRGVIRGRSKSRSDHKERTPFSSNSSTQDLLNWSDDILVDPFQTANSVSSNHNSLGLSPVISSGPSMRRKSFDEKPALHQRRMLRKAFELSLSSTENYEQSNHLESPRVSGHIRRSSDPGCLTEPLTSPAIVSASEKRRKAAAPFECEECGQTFTRKMNLNGHMRSHRGEKPFECEHPGCGKCFARRHDLRRHTLLHGDSRDYRCEGCQKMFLRIDALFKHLKSDAGAACAMLHGGKDFELENTTDTFFDLSTNNPMEPNGSEFDLR